jgi:hypothetical protein
VPKARFFLRPHVNVVLNRDVRIYGAAYMRHIYTRSVLCVFAVCIYRRDGFVYIGRTDEKSHKKAATVFPCCQGTKRNGLGDIRLMQVRKSRTNRLDRKGHPHRILEDGDAQLLSLYWPDGNPDCCCDYRGRCCCDSPPGNSAGCCSTTRRESHGWSLMPFALFFSALPQ